MQIKGIGISQAGKILACLELSKRLTERNGQKKVNPITSPDNLFEQIKNKVTNYYKEHFFVWFGYAKQFDCC